MRILLSAANFCSDPYPVYPLGMSVIAGALAAAGHEVEQFDPMPFGPEKYREEAAKRVAAFRPELIGVSIRNLDNIDSRADDDELIRDSVKVIRFLRTLAAAPMILGGPGYSLYPERILELTGAEYGVAGEGESAVVELAAALVRGERPAPGVYRKKSERQAPPLYSPEIAGFYHGETHIIPIQTKRGCPFRCAYCTYPMLEGHEMRLRDLDEVLRDIERIRSEWPDAMLYFVDAVFNDPGRCYVPLVEAMIERRLTVPWTGFVTPARLRDGDLERMAESGMVAVDLGVDAASDATLAGLGKAFSFDEVRRCCGKLLELNVGVTTSVMFGGPGETYETVAEGIRNLREIEPAYSIAFSGIRVLDGAPLVDVARREGKVAPDWDGLGSLYYFAPGLDPDRVHEMLLEGFKGSRFCVYPPGSRNRDLQMIHKFGYVKLRNLQLARN